MQVLYANPPSIVTFEDFQKYIAGQESARVTLAEYKTLYAAFLAGLTPSEQPMLLILAGGTGTGKTTYRKKHFGNVKNTHIHDMDEILIRLDGYQRDLKELGAKQAFENWWPTARTVADQLVQYALQLQLNVIYDRTCGAQGSFHDLQHAVKRKGYKAKMFAFSVPEKEAIRRVLKRAKVEGRTVTNKIIREYAQRFSSLFERYLAFIDEVHLFFNNKEIFVKKGHKAQIMEQDLYQKFLQSGSQYKLIS